MRRKAILLVTAMAAALILVGGTALAITYTTSKKASLKLNRTSGVATALTTLVSNAVGPALTLGTDSTDPNATPLSLDTNNASQSPMKVDSETKVTNLNADKLDNLDSDKLPGTIANVGGFAGSVGEIPRDTDFRFAGPTATVTTTADQRLVGSAQAALGLLSGSPQHFAYGLCYQPSGGGPISNFVGMAYTIAEVSTTRASYAASASVVPGAGTWKVGYCVENYNINTSDIDDNAYVNGWVQVVNQSPAGGAAASASENVEESNERREQP